MIRKTVIKAEEERLVYGEVYRPMDIDSQGEAMTAGEILKMAHAFISKGFIDRIDESHNQKDSGCLVVESFIARKDDPDGFAEGAWVLGVKIVPDDLWAKVKSGDLNGFSLFGISQKIVLKANVNIPVSGEGTTEKSIDGPLPPHSHKVSVMFSKSGDIVAGETEDSLSHTHTINKATATLASFGHSHRLIFEADNDKN